LIRRHYQPPASLGVPPSRQESTVLASLSEREREICLHLLRGHTLKSLAAALGIAVSTAETYRKRAYEKLGVSSRAQLVARCQDGA
jgi:DNA-binding CsgD family transcriptional regulator